MYSIQNEFRNGNVPVILFVKSLHGICGRIEYDKKQIVEFIFIICLANFTHRLNDALQLIPDLGQKSVGAPIDSLNNYAVLRFMG